MLINPGKLALINMLISRGPKLPCKLAPLRPLDSYISVSDVATIEGHDDCLEFLNQPPPDLAGHHGSNLQSLGQGH